MRKVSELSFIPLMIMNTTLSITAATINQSTAAAIINNNKEGNENADD